MIISTRKIMESLIFVFSVALFVLFILFDTYGWGKYVFLGLTLCIFLLGSLINGGKIALYNGPYVVLNLLFILFTFSSSLWALDSNDSIVMARTLLRTFICAYVMFITYANVDEFDATILLKVVMWSGYVVALYTIFFYGFDRILGAGNDTSLRLDNQFANINSIGLCCALSCVIQINLFCLNPRDKFLPSAFFMLPCLIVIASTQSRKALVFLLIGFFGYAFIRSQKNKKRFFNKVVKLAFLTLISVVGIYLLLQLDRFSGVKERMLTMINAALGNGKVDHSTIVRNKMKQLGLEWFFKYPIKGIGIANPHILAAKYLNFDAYLHDNFVELLCGGGIIGFCLYYSMYAYLFFELWRYRKVEPVCVTFFAMWLFLMFAMNYGMVTYYSKSENYYMMINFFYVYQLKKKSLAMGEFKSEI